MPRVTYTSPADGHQAGDKSGNLTAEKADWLISQGYATDLKDDADHVNDTTVAADQLPTDPANREAPGEDPPKVDKAKNAPEVGLGDPATPAKVDTVTGENKAPPAPGTPILGDGNDGRPVTEVQGSVSSPIEPAPETTIGRAAPSVDEPVGNPVEPGIDEPGAARLRWVEENPPTPKE